MVKSSLVRRRLKTISIFNPLDGEPKFCLRKQTTNVHNRPTDQGNMCKRVLLSEKSKLALFFPNWIGSRHFFCTVTRDFWTVIGHHSALVTNQESALDSTDPNWLRLTKLLQSSFYR